MIDDTVQTSWKRCTDPVKVWSDKSDGRVNELAKTPAQQGVDGGALPQSTTQTPPPGSRRAA